MTALYQPKRQIARSRGEATLKNIQKEIEAKRNYDNKDEDKRGHKGLDRQEK